MKNPSVLPRIFCASLLLPAALWAADEPKEIPLWPNGAPGSEGKTAVELVEQGANGERKVSVISKNGWATVAFCRSLDRHDVRPGNQDLAEFPAAWIFAKRLGLR